MCGRTNRAVVATLFVFFLDFPCINLYFSSHNLGLLFHISKTTLTEQSKFCLANCDLTPQSDRYVAVVVSLLLAKIVNFVFKYVI